MVDAAELQLLLSGAASGKVAGEDLLLLPDLALYWPRERALVIADLHLGKGMHFRRHGVPIPLGAEEENIRRLEAVAARLSPATLYLLGDLFHSALNAEWERFAEWRRARAEMKVVLVRGNHDILSGEQYESARLDQGGDEVAVGPFLLRHEPRESRERYVLSGHLHPAVRLEGRGRQRASLPCFWFGATTGILPAFGEFTGLHRVEPKVGDAVFVVAEGEVVEVDYGLWASSFR